MTPPIIVTEDTPPDMLAGSMDLTVVLPGGHSLKMSVERSTPMMDLLVQVTTANKMSTADYIIKPLNEGGPLPYKPSTPIGALDAWTIYIEPKQHAQCATIKKPLKTFYQPFEQTFRLQVHLPRNQLYVARISPKTRLTDILQQVCSEKNLDPLKYSLRHPSNLDQVLSLSSTLADYKLQEVTLVCNRTHPVEVSSVDIMSLQRQTSNPAYRNSMCEGSVSSGSLEGRSLSPIPSDESSASPPPLPPSRPTRKRRPAPKPPTVNQKALSEEKKQNGVHSSTVIYHSRNSSDSSGYHEASVLSESPQSNSVPESLSQCKAASVSQATSSGTLSRSLTDVTTSEPTLKQATSYNSITSLSSITGRKKKNAPPPPPSKNKPSFLSEGQQRTPSVSSTTSSTTTLDGNEVSTAVKSATLPPSSRLNSVPKELSPPSSPSPNTKVELESLVTPQGSYTAKEIAMPDEEVNRIFTNMTKNHISGEPGMVGERIMSFPVLPSPPSSLIQYDLKQSPDGDNSLDWEYRLPAPPTFRDESKSPTVTEFGTVTIGNLTHILDPEIVKNDNTNKTDLQKIIESEDRIKEHNELENLVKVKQSNFKAYDVKDSNANQYIKMPNEKNRLSVKCENHTQKNLSNEQIAHIDGTETNEENLINELFSVVSQRPSKTEITDKEAKQLKQELTSSSTLENFVITTYKDTKPVEVFEDDSIKSSVGEKRDKSKDDAVFRAPKARVKEPNLGRTSSFSMENKLSGPVIKRSMSYVSLLAANMPRNSQPYRAHLRQHSNESQDLWPRLRKTTSEVNIDNKDGKTKETSFWHDSSSELLSVQVLRNILSRSQVNLALSPHEPDTTSYLQQRDPLTSNQRFEDTHEENADVKDLRMSQSEEETKGTSKTKMEYSLSLDEDHSKLFTNDQRGPPSINLSTWSERPKRQIYLKNDCDYTSGFGKKSVGLDEIKPEVKTNKDEILSKRPNSLYNSVDVNLGINKAYKFGGRSKSISDLSRMPVVTAVELKKPYSMQIFDCTSLVQSVESNQKKTESTNSGDIQSNTENKFIGVNSLAKMFGVPKKCSTSTCIGSFQHEEFIKPTISTNGNSDGKNPIINQDNAIDKNEFKENTNFEGANQSLKNFSRLHSENESVSEIKAQAKICSGGYVGKTPVVSSFKGTVSHLSDKNDDLLNAYTSRNDFNTYKLSNSLQTRSSIILPNNSKQSFISDHSNPSNSIQKNDPSFLYFRQSQVHERIAKPINLQPVVKGFRVSAEIIPSFPKDLTSSTSANTKELRSCPSNLSNNHANPEPSVKKILYNRALSTSNIPLHSSTDIKETAKEKNTDKVDLLPSHLKSKSEVKTQTGNIPLPPLLLPTLKPVGDRKCVKLLPSPEADPRDLLMDSIRSFAKDNLKKVSK